MAGKVAGQLHPRQLAVWAATIGVVASVVTLLVAAVLTFTYRPQSPAGWFDYRPTTDVPYVAAGSGATEGWLVVHASAAAIAGMGAFAAFLILVWPTGSARRGRRVARKLLVLAGIATVVAAVAIVTRDMVTYEQLAYGSVRVVEDLAGYWPAAFDSDVRFVIVDGAEVNPAIYRLALTAHLVSPALVAVLLGLGAWSARRP